MLGCGSSAASDLFRNEDGGGAGGSSGTGAGAGGVLGSAGQGGSSGQGGSFGSGGVSGSVGVGGSGGSFGVGGSVGTAGASGAGGGCNFGGTWAAYATIPMSWPATIVLTGGSGTLQVWLLTVRTANGMSTSEIGQLCGIVLPPFATALTEKHGVRFLASAFDHMPEFQITATVGAYEVGGSFDTNPAAILFGAKMGNPITDPWPSLAQLVEADDDQDGNPGVTTPAEKGEGFADPVVEFILGVPPQRANPLFVASRTVVTMHGTATSCDELQGSIDIPDINGFPAFDSAIVGCRLSASGAPCTDAQAEFVNTNGPDFAPQSGSTFVQRRVRDGMTCGEVRGMYPPLPTP